MRAFIITGTSRGLGYEICKQLIKRNHLIFSVARNNNDSLIELAAQNDCKLHFVKYDLQNIDGISELIRGIMKRVNEEVESITLINNAAQVTPLGNIDNYRPEEAVKSIQTNLLAPILLTQSLINQTAERNVHRIIVNVSSGSAKDATAGMSLYCASKAALNMFTSCIQLEDHKSLTIYKVDPGMVDTTMQELARNQEGLSIAAFFKEAKEKGALKSAEDVAKKIVRRVLAS
ncbi:SDR family NAD(P)-dependent oxidoreductase [Paenibacillus dokdonensis]|uniref:SDR family NAD(P)-dependent oxidoreductase n=1 Tax=Paenibacillus dokdonensis TaxID=2567944 RepID=A0ABU6GUB6_9BACL|nr:SDR family NAD(P)-dependent oxidoreductase [Paenibacillus dokdonensis]MEC0242727.1 SDR family NAD(P)-dependent oxidoreductase [Paenibacillus dokdonensis]